MKHNSEQRSSLHNHYKIKNLGQPGQLRDHVQLHVVWGPVLTTMTLGGVRIENPHRRNRPQRAAMAALASAGHAARLRRNDLAGHTSAARMRFLDRASFACLPPTVAPLSQQFASEQTPFSQTCRMTLLKWTFLYINLGFRV